MTSAAGGRVKGGSLQIMYGIGGEHDLSERELHHLPRLARLAARARRQRRLGPDAARRLRRAARRAVALPASSSASCIPRSSEFVAELADAAAEGWQQRDAGMWEMRGEPQHHLSSKVLCWTALDRAVKLAPMLGEHGAKVDGVGGRARPHPRGGARARLEREAPGLRAGVRLRRARRGRAADAAGRASCPRPTSACARRSTRSRATSPRTASCCATATRRGSTPTASRARRGRS